MTTKSRHGTHSRRHGAGNRLSNRLAEQQRLERELRDALVSLDIPTVGNRREGKPRLRLMTVVLLSVRAGGTGRVKRWEYAAPATMWQAEVEHLARLEAHKQGLVIHAHLETFQEHRA